MSSKVQENKQTPDDEEEEEEGFQTITKRRRRRSAQLSRKVLVGTKEDEETNDFHKIEKDKKIWIFLSQIIQSSKLQAIINGDFNVNFLSEDNRAVSIFDLGATYRFTSKVTSPTRGDSCLNNIFVNFSARPVTMNGLNTLYQLVSKIDWDFVNTEMLSTEEKFQLFFAYLENNICVSFPEAEMGQNPVILNVKWFNESLRRERDILHLVNEMANKDISL
ncbi:hypothetical protein ABEB36_000393 [Hypothenemus hampei]|uniref:Uncharacterized protein n=1 Tax=Hypothenemus hampei TaxID=57062 RepID=A0ABD1FB19_HYPHA